MDEEIIKKAQESINNPDIVVNIYGFKVIWTSSKFSKLLGYSEEELFNVKVGKIVNFSLDQIGVLVKNRLFSRDEEIKFEGKSQNGKVIEAELYTKIITVGAGVYFVGKLKERSGMGLNMFF